MLNYVSNYHFFVSMMDLGVFIFSWVPDSFVQFFQFRYMCNRVHWIVVQADRFAFNFCFDGFSAVS